MKTKRYITEILMLAALMASVSCQHKDLCYDHPHNGHLQVVFDWAKVSETVEQNMELFLFPVGGGRPLHYQFYNIYGGYIDVPSGVYKAICANTGTGANRFEDSSDTFSGFTVTTRALSKSEDAILEPDILYSDHISDGIRIDSGKDQTLTMYPAQRTPRYTVIVKNVRNLNGAKNCTASLTKLSCSYRAADDEALDDSHSQSFEMARAGESSLVGMVTIFGHRHNECLNHILTLHFDLQSGNELNCTVDVSDRMTELARDGRMSGEIIIDLDIDLPKPISNGSGFQPTVDDWEGEEIDVSI